MSTKTISSTNGSRKTMPGLRTAWNCPRRLITPTYPCWMTLTARKMVMRTSSTTIPRTISPLMPLPLLGGCGCWSGDRRGLEPDHQRGLSEPFHHDRAAGGDDAVVGGDRRPALARDADVARAVGAADLLDHRCGLADHRLRPTEQLRR